jgi:hypothetical protein
MKCQSKRQWWVGRAIGWVPFLSPVPAGTVSDCILNIEATVAVRGKASGRVAFNSPVPAWERA